MVLFRFHSTAAKAAVCALATTMSIAFGVEMLLNYFDYWYYYLTIIFMGCLKVPISVNYLSLDSFA